jgi:glycosyltransferase involved in cell wall biosynthesis
LKKTLESVSKLNYPKELLEVIVVVDPEDNRAIDVIEDFKSRYNNVNVKVIVLDENNVSRARNLGIINSSSEIVAVIDDDIVLHPDTITAALKHLKNERVAAVGFPAISKHPLLSEKLHHWRFLGIVKNVNTVTPVTFFKKSILTRVGLYREDMGPPLSIHEDWELGSRIRKQGYEIIIDGRIPQIHLLHLRKITQDTGVKTDRHSKRKILSIIFRGARLYISSYIWKHWWSFLQVMKSSPTSQLFEYIGYFVLPILLFVLGLKNWTYSIGFTIVFLTMIILHNFLMGYYRKLKLWERLVYPVLLVLVRILRVYLVLIGLLNNYIITIIINEKRFINKR